MKDLENEEDIFRTVDENIQPDHIYDILNTSDEVDVSILKVLATPNTVKSQLAAHHNITPLHLAAGYNHIDAASLLIERGADVQALDDRNRLLLHIAAHYGHVDMIELLVEHGSDVNRQDRGGNTPLHLAAPLRNFHSCLKLIELGAIVDLRNSNDQLAYDLAETGDVKEVLRPCFESQLILAASGQAIYVDIAETHEHLINETDERPVDHDLMLDPVSSSHLFSTKHDLKIVELDPDDEMFRRVKYRMMSTIRVHASETSCVFSRYDILGIDLIYHKKVWTKYTLACQKLAVEYGSPTRNKNLSVNERLLFHGSNFIERIIRNGFDERYAQPNGMFGAGLYFADLSSKSNQYVFGWAQGCQAHQDKSCYICERRLIYAQVALGRSLVSKEAMPDCAHAPPGYSSVTGSPETTENLIYPEYVIYNGDQAYPLFVIRYRICP